MTCHAIPGEFPVIICRGRQRQRSCSYCREPHTRLCDWKLRSGVTCDAPLCDQHTHSPASGKDLCQRHAEIWKAQAPQAELPL